MTHPSIHRAKKLANLMDSAITVPVIRKKIGLDPLLGLFPGGGDAIALLISLYTLYVAYELGMPNRVLARMTFNVIVDALVGLVPVVGDVTDFFWKANTMNIQILEEAYAKHGSRNLADAQNAYTVVDVTAEPG